MQSKRSDRTRHKPVTAFSAGAISRRPLFWATLVPPSFRGGCAVKRAAEQNDGPDTAKGQRRRLRHCFRDRRRRHRDFVRRFHLKSEDVALGGGVPRDGGIHDQLVATFGKIFG